MKRTKTSESHQNQNPRKWMPNTTYCLSHVLTIKGVGGLVFLPRACYERFENKTLHGSYNAAFHAVTRFSYARVRTETFLNHAM